MESDILLAKPSFFRGVARIVDLWGLFGQYNYSSNELLADRLALESDLNVVSNDFHRGIESFVITMFKDDPESLHQLRETLIREKLNKNDKEDCLKIYER